MNKLTLTTVLSALALAIPAIKADIPLLNYETGEITSVDASYEYAPKCNRYADGDALIIEWTLQCAYVTPASHYPGTVNWNIPGFTSFPLADDKPMVSYQNMRTDIDESNLTVTVEAADYKDFPDYKLSPHYALEPDCKDCEPILFEITPYTGFYPEKAYGYYTLEYDTNSGHVKHTNLAFFPTLYDYEHSVVRAYTYVRFRIEDKQNGIVETTAADSSAPTYFDLSGRKVNRPENGRIYIKSDGDGNRLIKQ